jgi:hypothetical protein
MSSTISLVVRVSTQLPSRPFQASIWADLVRRRGRCRRSSYSREVPRSRMTRISLFRLLRSTAESALILSSTSSGRFRIVMLAMVA